MRGEGTDALVAEQVVAEIKEAGGVAVASSDSVASPQGGEAIVRTALEQFGRLDAVVSNAGIFNTIAFDALACGGLAAHAERASRRGFYLSQPAFRVMKKQGYGRFVFIASSAGLFGQPESAHYAAAKAGLLGLTNVVAIEGAPIRNPRQHRAAFRLLTHGDRNGRRSRPNSRAESSFLHAIEPDLVVPIVVFLASQACEVTHHNYSACAGRFGRVFVGLGRGWLADAASEPSADDIAQHLAEVSATEPFSVPDSIFDEVAELCQRLGITG